MIESRDIPDLVFERLPVFSGTWHLYFPGSRGPRRPGSYAALMVALGIYAARLAASRDEASLDRVLRLVEEIIEGGRRGAVEVYFLEILAGGLNELGVDWADIRALAGPKTREAVGTFRAMGFWEGIVLPFGLSALLR